MKLSKRTQRELFFKALFMVNFHEEKEALDVSIESFLREEGVSDIDEFRDRLSMLCNNLSMIDDTINSLSKGWKTTRIAKVDLSLLRMAIYEMKFENQAKAVAINEAVELAKKYGSDRSYAFINGILSNVE